ncbi:hypothetical protein FACS189487_11530 [Campylobacterota bacterium]|nr:hypothetical protein FACS189487_11530 [Campylobacterota bacterium]
MSEPKPTQATPIQKYSRLEYRRAFGKGAGDLLFSLLAKQQNEGEHFIGTDHSLAEAVFCSESTIRRLRSKLIEYGVIEIEYGICKTIRYTFDRAAINSYIAQMSFTNHTAQNERSDYAK